MWNMLGDLDSINCGVFVAKYLKGFQLDIFKLFSRQLYLSCFDIGAICRITLTEEYYEVIRLQSLCLVKNLNDNRRSIFHSMLLQIFLSFPENSTKEAVGLLLTDSDELVTFQVACQTL